MFGTYSDKRIVAIALIESGSAAIVILKTGARPEALVHAREDLPLEERAEGSQRSSVVRALSSAGEKALAMYANSPAPVAISTCYCIVGAPWARSFAGFASSKLNRSTTITDAMIEALAKQALENQKEIDRPNLLEASVTRILLNGYPTSDPAGKRAEFIDIFTLASDCDPVIKKTASDALAKLFPHASITWRSSTRAILAATRQQGFAATSLIVEVGRELTDLIAMRKGILDQQISVRLGLRQTLEKIAKGKPAEETATLMELIEKDRCDDAACQEFQRSIAKAEPDFVHVFGEALAKLVARRKLSIQLLLAAPPALSSWLSQFFARIDFTQFTATAQPFSVKVLSPADLSGVSRNDLSILADPGLSFACNLVNSELSS